MRAVVLSNKYTFPTAVEVTLIFHAFWPTETIKLLLGSEKGQTIKSEQKTIHSEKRTDGKIFIENVNKGKKSRKLNFIHSSPLFTMEHVQSKLPGVLVSVY